MRRTFLFSLLIAFFVSYSSFGQIVTFGETPVWVRPVEIPVPPSNQGLRTDVPDGFYESLVSIQTNLDEAAEYTHYVVNVISYGGITNASQLLIVYDSSYQKVIFHHLYIWRKGVKIDRTSEVSFEMLNNEDQLAYGIYNGQCQAYDILKDIRKDDLIDYAYTTVGFNPIYDNTMHALVMLQAMKPADRIDVQLLYGKDKDYRFEFTHCDSLRIDSLVDGNFKIVRVRADHIKATSVEENIPPWVSPFAYLELTSFKNWKEVNLWAQDVFKLEKEPSLDGAFAEIFTGTETTDEKINKLIDYVQDEIRYMGVESGIGSIKPANPEQVVSHRYGDCKDKSLLLVSMLKQIGIQNAWPVLVNTYLMHEAASGLPGNKRFNHCIVKFEYNNGTYWVDPTAFLQGGNYMTIHTDDFGRVLVVGQPSDTLPLMNPRQPEALLDYTYVFDSPSFNEPVTLTFTSVRTGAAADARRATHQTFSSKDMSDEFLKELRLTIPTVEMVEEPEFFDDPVKNEFRIVHHMRVNDFWDTPKGEGVLPGLRTFGFEPIEVHRYMELAQCIERKSDLYINYPFNINTKFIFNCPTRLNYLDATDVFDTDAFYYSEAFTQLHPNTVQAEYIFRTKAHSITPEQFKEACEAKKKIMDALRFSLLFIE